MFDLTFLGSSASVPSADRDHPGLLVEAGGHRIMVDCGEGYTARSLSGLICKCGVLRLGAPLSIEQLYARYRLYGATTIRTLLADGLPKDASIEEQWLVKYSRPTRMKFVGVWDTVGSLGLPLGSTAAKVHRYRFLDTHLRLDNEYAFHALALDEHRHNFEPNPHAIGVREAIDVQLEDVFERHAVVVLLGRLLLAVLGIGFERPRRIDLREAVVVLLQRCEVEGRRRQDGKGSQVHLLLFAFKQASGRTYPVEAVGFTTANAST